MIDHILGRPSASIRRSQIFLVLFFWIWRLYKGDGAPLPTRTISGLPAGPSGVPRPGGGGKGVKGRKTWWWRLWVGLVGRSKFGVGWMNKINERLSELSMPGSEVRELMLRTLYTLSTDPGDIHHTVRSEASRRSTRYWR
jgi:hypothetical protein